MLAMVCAKDPCACLNWKQVYKNDLAMCGEGLEYHVANPGRLGYSRREAINAFQFAGADWEICNLFFKKLDSDRCVNVGPYARGSTDWTGMTWCYVSKECEDLHGGKRLFEHSNTWMDHLVSFVNDPKLAKVSEVSWKLCRPGKDKQLRDLDVDDLFKICERQSLSYRFCVKGAYSGAWTYFFWPQIHELWMGRADPNVYYQLPELLRDAVQKNDPMVVDTQLGGLGDLIVVQGQDAFHLRWSPEECAATQYCRSLIGGTAVQAEDRAPPAHSEL